MNVGICNTDIEVESGLGMELHQEIGFEGAWNRVRVYDALATFLADPNREKIPEKRKIGQILVATVENYIQRPGPNSAIYRTFIYHPLDKADLRARFCLKRK